MDDAHVALGPIACAGRGEQLDVLDGGGRYLPQSCGARQRAGFTIDVYQELAATAEGQLAVGIRLYRGNCLQHVGGSASGSGQCLLRIDALAIQPVHHLASLSGNGHLFQLPLAQCVARCLRRKKLSAEYYRQV